ncbi:MAG TPA: DUF3303 family protein [Candidatus Acidoferrales bacterium]|nr:DUF3303 family protein [Candidatus Acidoferrales bacterium]
MLFVAEYDLTWEMLDAAIAKRLEWEDAKPDGFRFVAEYVWQDRDPPFRGIAIIETDDIESINAFVLHYGPTLRTRIFPASDVLSAIRLTGNNSNTATTRMTGDRRRKRTKK